MTFALTALTTHPGRTVPARPQPQRFGMLAEASEAFYDTRKMGWPIETRDLFERYRVDPNRIRIKTSSNFKVSPQRFRQLMIDCMTSMRYAELNQYLPHKTNDFLGAIARNGGTPLPGVGMNIEMDAQRYSIHYQCAEQSATLDAIQKAATAQVPKYLPGGSVWPGAHQPTAANKQRVANQLQISTLALQRWPEWEGGRLHRPFLDGVEPCGHCETWMGYKTYYKGDSIIATLKYEESTNSHTLHLMHVQDRMRYWGQKKGVLPTAAELKKWQENPTNVTFYDFYTDRAGVEKATGAKRLLELQPALYAQIPNMFAKAASEAAHYKPFRVNNQRTAAAAVLMSHADSDGQWIHAAPVLESKARWYMQPGMLAYAKALSRITEKPAYKDQAPLTPREAIGTNGHKSGRPFPIAVAYYTDDPNFAPSTQDLTYLARPEIGGPNLIVATVYGLSDHGVRRQKIRLATVADLHPFLKRPDPWSPFQPLWPKPHAP